MNEDRDAEGGTDFAVGGAQRGPKRHRGRVDGERSLVTCRRERGGHHPRPPVLLISRAYLAPFIRVGRPLFVDTHSRIWLTANGARIAGGWWRVILRGGRAEDLGEDGFQRVGPKLVRLRGQVQPVVRHAFAQPAVRCRQFVVDVYVTYGFSIRERGDLAVGGVDHRHHRGI